MCPVPRGERRNFRNIVEPFDFPENFPRDGLENEDGDDVTAEIRVSVSRVDAGNLTLTRT